MKKNTTLDKRFLIKETIFEDLFAIRYRGIDSVTDNDISIKLWKFPIAERLIKIKGNLEKISNYTFHNVLNLIDYGDHQDGLFTVHEYIKGISLHELIKQGTIISVDDMVHLFESIILGLESLHAKNISHGGIKPSNIIIPIYDNSCLMDNAHLSDPLQSRILYINDPIEKETIRESVYSLAPESIIASGVTITPESDQYALGVLYYYLLSGHYPHENEDITKILYSHTSEPFKPLSGAPDYINNILMKLMQKKPEMRYTSVKELNAHFTTQSKNHRDILAGYYNSAPDIDLLPSFTGRAREMKILKSTLYDLLNGEGTACFITGQTGIGKTRIIKEFLKYAETYNIRYVYYNSTEQRNRKKPYALVSAALEEYLVFFRNYDREKQQKIKQTILQGIEKIAPLLLKIDPAFEEIIGKPEIAVRPLEGDRDKQRFEMLINRFIHNIAEAEKGIILIVEDIEEADPGSLELTGNLLPHVSENKILFISSANVDQNLKIDSIFPSIKTPDTAADQFLLTLHIKPLDHDEHRGFIARVLHASINTIDTIADFIFQKSSGIPHLSLEIIKELTTQQIIFFNDTVWQFDLSKASSFKAPESIFAQLLKKTERLSRTEKIFLNIASVFIYKIQNEAFKKYISEYTDFEEEYEQTINSLIETQYLEKDVTDHNSYIFCDSRIREIFYKSLENDLKQKIHLERAIALESNTQKNSLFEIAHHYINSSDAEKAVEYSLKAGNKAMDAFLYEDAVNYFSYCIENKTVDNSIRTRASINSSLIDINLGHYQQAISRLMQIIEIADRNELPGIYKLISIAYQKLSDFSRSETYALKGLKILNEHIPSNKPGLLIKTIQQFISYYVIRFFQLGRLKTKQSEKIKAETSIDIMKNLCWSYMVYNIPGFIYLAMRIRTLAGRHLKGTEEEAMSYEVFGGMLMAARMFNRTEKYIWKAIEINQKKYNESVVFKNYKILGFVSLWQCEFEQAIKHFTSAVEGFKSIGDISEEMNCYPPLFDSYGLQSRYKEAETTINTLHDYSLSNNDIFLLGIAAYNRMLLAIEQGNFDDAKKWSEQTLKLMDQRDQQRMCITYTGVGYYHLMAEDYEQSIENCNKALDIYNKNHFLGQYTVNLFCFRAEALIRHAEKHNYLDDPQVINSCQEAVKKSKPWPTHYGKALRSMGLYYADTGSYGKAKKYLKKSIEWHEKNHMRFELARSIYELAICEEKNDNHIESKNLYERAYIIFDDINSQYYATHISMLLGLHSRSSTVVDNVMARKRLYLFMEIIYEVRKQDDAHELFNTILSSCIDITSSDFGIIFIADEDEDALTRYCANGRTVTDEINLKSLAMKIFNSRRIDFIEDMDSSEIRDYLFISDQDSYKMAVPIFTGNEILGICCLEKKLNKNDYTDDEFSLLNMLLFQSGVLFDNMRLKKYISEGRFEKKKESITENTESKIRKVINYLQKNYIEDVSREGLAALVDMHPDHLGKMFKVYSGMKMSDFINELRIRDAAQRLETDDDSVIDIAFSVGFESLRTFNRAFTKFLGTSPRTYREKMNRKV